MLGNGNHLADVYNKDEYNKVCTYAVVLPFSDSTEYPCAMLCFLHELSCIANLFPTRNWRGFPRGRVRGNLVEDHGTLHAWRWAQGNMGETPGPLCTQSVPSMGTVGKPGEHRAQHQLRCAGSGETLGSNSGGGQLGGNVGGLHQLWRRATWWSPGWTVGERDCAAAACALDVARWHNPHVEWQGTGQQLLSILFRWPDATAAGAKSHVQYRLCCLHTECNQHCADPHHSSAYASCCGSVLRYAGQLQMEGRHVTTPRMLLPSWRHPSRRCGLNAVLDTTITALQPPAVPACQRRQQGWRCNAAELARHLQPRRAASGRQQGCGSGIALGAVSCR
jgi:hypothetical protein